MIRKKIFLYGGKSTSFLVYEILKENKTIFIPRKSKHRLANESAKKLIIIELWYGDILDENDIERFEDIYERI